MSGIYPWGRVAGRFRCPPCTRRAACLAYASLLGAALEMLPPVVPQFELAGSMVALHTERPALGGAGFGKCRVPTIDGREEVKVKPGTQPNDRLRMRGYGVPMDAFGHKGRRGDQYVVVKVTIPRSLKPEQRRLLEEFRGGPKPAAAADAAEENSEEGEKKKKRRWWGN